MMNMVFGRRSRRQQRSVDATVAETSLRHSHPLLLHPDESIDLAFHSRSGRDQSYLTSHRILLVYSKGLAAALVGSTTNRLASSVASKRKRYVSIPYSSIQAFAVETTTSKGSNKNSTEGVVGDVDVQIWSTGTSFIVIDFAPTTVPSEGIATGGIPVDPFGLQQYFNSKVQWRVAPTPSPTVDTSAPMDAPKAESAVTEQSTPSLSIQSLMEWMSSSNNVLWISPNDAHDLLTHQYPLLWEDTNGQPERVTLAYFVPGTHRQHYVVLTNLRYLSIATTTTVATSALSRFFGTKLVVTSVPWRSVAGCSVSVASDGASSDVCLYTTVTDLPELRLDLNATVSAVVNGWAVHSGVSHWILAAAMGEYTEADIVVPADTARTTGPMTVNAAADMEPLPTDAAAMNQYYHDTVPLLVPSERVELAFQARRDVVLFTTRRILIVDPQGYLKGGGPAKTEYTTIPWQSVVAFGVKTAGRAQDRDSEALIYTNMMFVPPVNENDPPKPGMSFRELDFDKEMVNVMAIKQYLSTKCLGTALNSSESPTPARNMTAELADNGLEGLLARLGDEAKPMEPSEVDTMLHSTVPLLLENETTVLAFQSGRNVTLFTNLRMMVIETEGWSGDKVLFRSIPFDSIRAFSAVSSGGWDRNAEIDIYTRNQWSLNKLKVDFRQGKADIVAIQQLLGAMVLGSKTDVAKYLESQEPTVHKCQSVDLSSVASIFTNSSMEENATAVDEELHNDAPILLEDEHVARAFRTGRDLFVYTNVRLLMVDVIGLQGKKIKYQSFPWKWCQGFDIETAGPLDCDAELHLYNDTPARRRIKHSILVKRFDIHEMQASICATLLFPNGKG